jgi:Domain of unknown function (DUF5624)
MLINIFYLEGAMKLLRYSLYAIVLLIVSQGLFADTTNITTSKYITPEPFMNLFFNFTGNNNKGYPQGKVNIAKDLANTMSGGTDSALSTDDGPLILILNSDFYLYDASGKLLVSQVMRTAPDTGFYELTALSHIGPALAYLAYIESLGSDSWKTQMQSLKDNIVAVKKLNAQPKDNWVTKINSPYYKPFTKQLNNMFDYACSMSGNYINDVLNGKKTFNMAALQTDFLEGNTEYPIPFNNIMVGTFMLVAYENMNRYHAAISKVDFDWAKAKVLIRFTSGSNITAGVSVDGRSNWLVPFLIGLSKNVLPDNRIFIAPYLQIKPSIGKTQLSKDDLNYYNFSWSQTYNRGIIADAVFTNITSMFVPKRPVMPGDFRYSRDPTMNDFLMRLKFSLANATQMLSSTVGFWMSGELTSKNWDLSKVRIPGFNSSFPKGISAYPSNNPAIK